MTARAGPSRPDKPVPPSRPQPTVLIATFVGAVAVSVLVAAGATAGLDQRATRAVQAHATDWLDAANQALLLAGSVEVATVAVAILALLAWRWYGARTAALIAGTYVAVLGIELVTKLLLAHAGPPPEFYRSARVRPPTGGIGPESSYPSGHAVRAAYLACVLCMEVSGVWARVAASAYVLVVCIGRVYMGVHWLSDVVGGALLGIMGALVVLMLSTGRGRSHTMESDPASRGEHTHGY